MVNKDTHKRVTQYLAAALVLVLLLASCQMPPIQAPESPTASPASAAESPLVPGETAAAEDRVAEEAILTEEVQFTSGDLTLAGTLTLPEESGPHPALIFITGSGPQDRDNAALELLSGYRPYDQMAHVLAQSGIASLRYDDRGVGGSQGEIATATSPELLADAEAALVYLRERPQIDPEQIGVLGHSQGGIIAAMLAAAHPDIAFVVALATPALSGYETMKDSLSRLAETTSLPPEVVGPAAEREVRAMDLALKQDWDALEAHLEEGIWASVEQVPEEQREAFGDLDAFVETQVTRAMESYRSERFRDELLIDRADAWVQVEAPVLALYAEHETTVFAETHAPVLAELLADNGDSASNEDVTIATVPGVNHLFLEAEDGNLQQFIQSVSSGELPEGTQDVPERVLIRIVEWVQEQTDAGA